MARSVDYLTGADYVAYISAHEIEDQYFWDIFKQDLTYDLQQKFPSLEEADRWDGNETHIFLENGHCEIGISEYCGLVSVSIRAKEDYYEKDMSGLHKRWIDKISKKFLSIGNLSKQGTFSNGEAVFTRTDGNWFSSKEGHMEWM